MPLVAQPSRIVRKHHHHCLSHRPGVLFKLSSDALSARIDHRLQSSEQTGFGWRRVFQAPAAEVKCCCAQSRCSRAAFRRGECSFRLSRAITDRPLQASNSSATRAMNDPPPRDQNAHRCLMPSSQQAHHQPSPPPDLSQPSDAAEIGVARIRTPAASAASRRIADQSSWAGAPFR